MEEAWTGREEAMSEIVEARGPGDYGTLALNLVDGLHSDGYRVMILDVPNRSSLPFLDEEAIVEVPCVISRGGIVPDRDRQCPAPRAGPHPLRPGSRARRDRRGAVGLAGDGDQGARPAPAGPVGRCRRAHPRRVHRRPADPRRALRRLSAAHDVDDRTVPLLDQAGQWTHRDRHQHLHFGIEVPDRTVELRVRFRWTPRDMGSEHLANAASLSLCSVPTGSAARCGARTTTAGP